ncbi:hypothetical protein C8A05DRAFT_44276 [Staphylotrichum tortipilum]|uniref:DUF676 domain-containing protein n=1 Tax=Staphylotrichum tortipilum TaxID=2831512 RepID=A0AAN6MJX2_9PEZI|nr:hypothetical protein C8A05DRAFT_44276 [Staphylotrichum longicolle]
MAPHRRPSSIYGLTQSSRDPRSSSTQSLVPSKHDGTNADQKRTLLVVYIHGFLGNNTSFRSFPAHVHNLLKELLAATHSVHSKIYPRYKTYKAIDVATDNFSKWLAPHESPTTDVVLVGHSMGGLLAAEAVLLPSQDPYNTSSPFRHRILGTVSLDAPLLGLHPGIVVSGVASLFRPSPSPTQADEAKPPSYTASTQSQPLSPEPSIISDVSPSTDASTPLPIPYPSSSALPSAHDSQDSYFDPPFVNDVAFVDRGWLKNVIHFAAKHKEENLFAAAANHLVSHLEFGACLADYPELRSRYNRLRALEDIQQWQASGAPRVRFVNYYTVSTGTDALEKHEHPATDADSQAPASKISTDDSGKPTPRISIDELSDASLRESLELLEPMPEPEPSPETPNPSLDPDTSTPSSSSPSLPDLPPLPPPPTPPDLTLYPDKSSRKQAETAHKLALKAHTAAAKAHASALRARQKSLDAAAKSQSKSLRAEQKAAEKASKLLRDEQKTLEKEQARTRRREEKEEKKLVEKAVKEERKRAEQAAREERRAKRKKEKEQKRRKFCLLPHSGGGGGGGVDPAWVEVFMEGVDEVGAHCGLFVPGAHYEGLVGDVAGRIVRWVVGEGVEGGVGGDGGGGGGGGGGVGVGIGVGGGEEGVVDGEGKV